MTRATAKLAPDKLATYQAKRNFARTAEPSGKRGAKTAPASRLIVQHHFATRDHFDLRLEIDGVLASWAVTRGPSANPADKRLAVRTEDHPLSYASYEGEIPKGEYGGGTVILWESTTYSPLNGDPAQALAKGEIKFEAHGERMRGGWVLVKMRTREKRENWLLIKERDAFVEKDDSLATRYPDSIATGRDRETIAQGAAPKAKKATKKPPPEEVAMPKQRAPLQGRTRSAPTAEPSAITHADRVVYPKDGVTKGDIAAHYERVAERMAPHLRQRIISLIRAPETIEAEMFFQRHPLKGMAAGVVAVDIGDETYMALEGAAGLHTAAQFGAIEVHGWMSRIDTPDHPDRMILDLDPDPKVDFAAVKTAAKDIAAGLDAIGVRTWPLVTGGKGIHVVAPLDGALTTEDVEEFAHHFAGGLARQEPQRFVATMSKARREGRIFIDWMRNKRAATAILPWSLRARPGAPVAMPVSWAALARLTSAAAFTIKSKLKADDGWNGFFETRQTIPRQALEFVRRAAAS